MRFLDTARVRLRMNERIPARDGTELSIDVYLPPQIGRYPALLFRTPADNNRSARSAGSVELATGPADRWKALAAQGFIVAAADVRGRGDSDGHFEPFSNEGSDGLVTVEWLRAHPECNGRVGAFGSGYAAFCAWAALAQGASIDAIVSFSPFGNLAEGLVHRGGAVRLDWLFWLHLVGGRAPQPAAMPSWPKIHGHWPLSALGDVLGHSDIPWREWLSHLDRADPYWRSVDLADRLAARPVPALHVTGWWDPHLGGARYYYEAAKRAGAPQSLIVGPWDATSVRHPRAIVGGFDFGPRSLIDPDETLVQYFGAMLRGERNAFARPVTRIFVTGRNEWIEADGWPAARSTQVLHLSSRSGANTRCGDGVLGTKPGDGSDEVVHNPAVPVDFQPGFVSFASGALTLEQAHITGRDEALVYTTPPLAATLTVAGRPKVKLTVTAETADADLFVLLSDSFPQARDLHLSHSVLRLGTLNGFRPGEATTVTRFRTTSSRVTASG
ncbi:MAG: CocE/NonD family hydrolase [Steroidobacteraceae bacterium]